jgi:hypothetical protein
LRRPAESPWKSILQQPVPERLDVAGGRRVLLATGVGGHPIAPVVDGLVGASLWLRGADVSFLLCDAALPACEMCQYVSFPDVGEFVRHGPQRRLCAPCFDRGRSLLEPLPPQLHRYRELLPDGAAAASLERAASMSLQECYEFEEDGLRLGEQARASTIRFFGKADLDTEPPELVLAAARRYAAGAITAAAILRRALERLEPEVVVAHHGVYLPQGVLGEVARSLGVRVVNWGTSYRDRTVIYSHGDTYHRTLVDEPVSAWADRRLTADEERELLEFLAARRRGEGDWSWYTPEAALRREEQERVELAAALGLDPDRPVVGLLTNVIWDAQLYYEGHAFRDMLEWLWFTIDHFAERPDRQLLIRIHPHEVKFGNRQPVEPELRRRYPVLPENVHVVGYDSPLNTYGLMSLCRSVLIYGTKTGVELTPLGQPVVVAADAWIRGKGLTLDASSKQEYAALLERAPALEPLDETTVVRARRYSYHYFFRRMIPLSSLEPGRSELTLGIESLADLLPGRDPGLDVICQGILEGREFIFDGESTRALPSADA